MQWNILNKTSLSRYLAHGTPQLVLALQFKMGLSTVANIIIETCTALWEELSRDLLKPKNEIEWGKIADDFWRIWGMPNCVAAIDGKHVNIVCPPHAGSLYYNYKKRHSIVLLFVCNADYRFIAVDIGAHGSSSDGGVLARSKFGEKLLANDLKWCRLPTPAWSGW